MGIAVASDFLVQLLERSMIPERGVGWRKSRLSQVAAAWLGKERHGDKDSDSHGDGLETAGGIGIPSGSPEEEKSSAIGQSEPEP